MAVTIVLRACEERVVLFLFVFTEKLDTLEHVKIVGSFSFFHAASISEIPVNCYDMEASECGHDFARNDSAY